MSLSDRPSSSFPDEPTPAAARRFELWRAMMDISKAQADGRLSCEQLQLLSSLAENLQQLAGQLGQLAELGQQYAQQLNAREATPDGPARLDERPLPPHPSR